MIERGERERGERERERRQLPHQYVGAKIYEPLEQVGSPWSGLRVLQAIDHKPLEQVTSSWSR